MIPLTPTSRNRVPAIDTDITRDHNISVPSPTPISNNDASSLHFPQTGPSPTSPTTSRTQSNAHKVNPTDRARTESRKLLAHVLDQLHHRTLPPGIFEAFNHPEVEGPENNLGLLLQTVKGAVVNPRKMRQDGKHHVPTGVGEDDSDEDGEREFSTDATYDLMLQLKDLLRVSMDRNWHILDDDSPTDYQNDGYHESNEKSGISPFRRARNTLQSGGQRSRSLSPSNSDQGRRVRTPELLSSCISVLASVILEDCRYQIALPRPSCPPNALQVLTLDVAQFLLHTHRNDPIIISKIGFAMIPAFSTFRPEMHGRLLTFFETAVIRGVLEDLDRIQGANHVKKPLNSSASSLVAIHIDQAQEAPPRDAGLPRWKPWSLSLDNAPKMQSTYASSQSLALYSLSSLISPLLATILEFVDLEPKLDVRTDVLHRFSRLLRPIVENKLDAYFDLLQVVGYHTHKARRAALGILCALWPKAVGHIGISRPFNFLYTVEEVQTFTLHEPNEHQFVPWRFPSQVSSPEINGTTPQICHSCAESIRGFGLLCILCTCKVHFDCYDHPNGSKIMQYSLASDHDTQRMAVYRFSSVLVDRNQPKLKAVTNNYGHQFQPINLFTLCLCIVCRQPLWGCTSQGLNCSFCMLCVHQSCLTCPATSTSGIPSCSSDLLTSDFVNTDWNELRHSCISYYADILQLSYSDLEMLSFEEISVLHCILWIQAQIIDSGIALGSIVVTQNGTSFSSAGNYKIEEFELHHIIKWCEDLLTSNRQQRSNALDDYMVGNPSAGPAFFMMFDWTTLMYIRSILRSSIGHYIPRGSSDLLDVSQPGASITSSEISSPFEVVPLSHMRDSLGYGLNIHSDDIARLLLSHLHHLGLFERTDHESLLFNGDDVTSIYCSFPLPFGLDLSPMVEVLVAAVEGCLEDHHLSAAEVGLLLLVRRFWPNGLASDYALRRLTRCILSWILAEDDHLATILQDYLAKGKPLPGVRSPQDKVLWPSSDRSRLPASSMNNNNGGDYLATRRALLSRYAKPWLLALHDLDPVEYASFVYDACLDIDFPPNPANPNKMNFTTEQSKNDVHAQHDDVLRSITKLCYFQVIFTAFDNLFIYWLESTSQGSSKESFHSLPRLFSRERDNTSTSTRSEQTDLPLVNAPVDSWQVITRVAEESSQGLCQSLQWLCLFAHSGVDIPLMILETFAALVNRFGPSLADSLLLSEAVMVSTWLKSQGRQELQDLISQLHERLDIQITSALKGKEPDENIVSFVRITLASCLLLYGCDRLKIKEFGFILDSEISSLPSRRKINVSGSIVVDPVVIDPRLMVSLDRYMSADSEDVSCLVGKFLYLFMMYSPYLETYEVDNFILRNGTCLANCVWKLYDIQRPEISELRAHFLLRSLVVDSEPFKDVLDIYISPASHWERRLLAINRLFRVVLDVISPSFNVEDRQWRPSLADVFYDFFTSLWADQKEEIRIAAATYSATLLPAHFQAISTCWNELLLKSPITERLKLISFLTQLRSYFPHWKVLSWDAIVEALVEYDYEESDPAAAHLSLYGLSSASDPELVKLRVSVVFLSLQMIADGVPIDSFVLLRIKGHLANVIGFHDVTSVPSQVGRLFQIQFGELSEINDFAFPCVSQLLTVMDSPHRIDIPPSVMANSSDLDEKPVSVLAGSALVDVFLTMFCSVDNPSSIPILTCKNMLETLCIIIYKHDFESRVLKHLQQALRRAVMRALDYLDLNISYDLRQLAFSVVNAFVKRWHSIMGSLIYTAVEATVKLVASQSQYHSQDALTAQAKAFLDSSLTKYAQNGLFANLLKRQLHQDFFVVLKQIVDGNARNNPTAPQSLCELLFRDVLTRGIDADHVNFQNVLNNTRVYVEVVCHEGFSSELVQFTGQQLIQFSRRAIEWNPESMNPDSILIICAVVIHHNKARSRDIISSIDTILRALSSRLNVGTEGLSRLLQATSSLHKKTSNETGVTNIVLHSLLEILSDGLRLKARVLPSTLKSMIEVVMTTDTPGGFLQTISRSSFLGLVEPAIHFIQNHPWQDGEKDFAASLAAAQLVLQASTQDPNIMNSLSEYGTEKVAHTNLRVRSWSILTIAALLDSKQDWCTTLFAQLSSFSYAYHGSIRVYSQGLATSTESALIDLNYAYIAIKLWILLAFKVSESSGVAKDFQTLAVWNELWPPFEGLIDQFELDSGGALYLAAGTLVLSSVAELFIFLRTLHTPIALDVSVHITTLNRLRQLGPGDTLNQKLTRALQYMLEPPPEMQFETLVNQAAKDVVAAEKLRTLDTRIFQDRKTLERHRREIRVIT